MRVCIPPRSERGLKSTASGHFGPAPYFVVHDTGVGRRSTERERGVNGYADHGRVSPFVQTARSRPRPDVLLTSCTICV